MILQQECRQVSIHRTRPSPDTVGLELMGLWRETNWEELYNAARLGLSHGV